MRRPFNPMEDPFLRRLLDAYDASDIVDVRSSDVSLLADDVQELLWALRRVPVVHSPARFRSHEEHPGTCSRTNGFETRFKSKLIAASGHRCEVAGCGQDDAVAPLSVHHIQFTRDRGLPLARNAEVVCVDCHRGSHGLLSLLPPSSPTRRGFKEDTIAVSGVPISVMFQVTSRFEAAGLLTLEAWTRPLREVEQVYPEAFADRETVYHHDLRGPGLRAFRTCQILLRRIVRASFVYRTSGSSLPLPYRLHPIAGRIHPEAEDLLLSFVERRFIAPLRAPSRAA